MDLLIITAASVKGTTTAGVDIAVKVNGQPAALDAFGGVQLPPAPRPLPIEVTLTPSAKHLFGASGKFAYLGNGQLLPADDGARAPHFRPVRAASIEGGSAVMSLIGYVSRLRDVTIKSFELLRTSPDRRPEEADTSKTGTLEPVSHVRTLGDPPLLGANLSFDKAETISPEADVFIFEVAVDPAPKLIAVACPRNLIAGSNDQGVVPPPVLLYFHSTMGQNVDAGFYRGSYPFSYDFLQYGLNKYLFHEPNSEPLTGWGGKGMPYQMRRSGKQAIFVLPLNKPFAEVGVMINATATQDILEEVTALLFRQRGLFVEPGLGRVALGAFSSGNMLVTEFLRKNKGTPFLDDVLKEVYSFDIPKSRMVEYLDAAKPWLDGGDNADKMLRLYTQESHPQDFAKLLGTSVPAPPYVIENAQKLRTAVCISTATWFPLAKPQMVSPTDFQTVHQLIAETCLVDAMRRSGFPAIPK